MMDLEQFKSVLRSIDEEFSLPKMYECGVAQVDAQTFSFEYDALCPVMVRFEDGAVLEWTHMLADEIQGHEPHNVFKGATEYLSLQMWIEHQLQFA